MSELELMKDEYNKIYLEVKRLEHVERNRTSKQFMDDFKQTCHSLANYFLEKDPANPLANVGKCAAESISHDVIRDYNTPPEKLWIPLLLNSIAGGCSVGTVNIRYDPIKDQQSICLICNKYFNKHDLCRIPDCEHLFHAKCICGLQNPGDSLVCPICGTLITDRV